MSMETIVQLIQTFGVAIAMCVAMAWFINKKDTESAKQFDRMYEQMQASDERHRNEVSNLAEALANNTVVVQKLVDTLNGVKENE